MRFRLPKQAALCADLGRAKACLPRCLRETLSNLSKRSLPEAAALHPTSRATFYRRVAELRLEFLSWGLGPPW